MKRASVLSRGASMLLALAIILPFNPPVFPNPENIAPVEEPLAIADETLPAVMDPRLVERFSTQGQSFSCLSVAGITDVECAALTALFNGLTGEGWVHAEGWLQDPNPCTWYGVTCLEGAVAGLDLASNNLQGELPAELGTLSGLNSLNLEDNPGLSGELPAFLMGLPLNELNYAGTSMCEPRDAGLQAWLGELPVTSRTQVCNQVPGDILLTGSSIEFGSPVGSVVGSFDCLDPEGGSCWFSLAEGEGDTDNGSFEIRENQLVLTQPLNQAAQSVSIRVRAQYPNGEIGERAFQLQVWQAAERSVQTSDVEVLASTLDVCPSGCSYASIQAAIDAAAPGDTVQVAAGTYYEHLAISKNLTLSGAGKTLTIVNGSGTFRVLGVFSPAVVNVSGFTFTNGFDDAGYGGGGVYNTGELHMTSVEVSYNSAVDGGGVRTKGYLTIADSDIHHNTAEGGGGLSNYNGSMYLENVTVRDNTGSGSAGGIMSYYPSLPAGIGTVLQNVSVLNNHSPFAGGGMRSYGGPVTITDSLFEGNTSENFGGAWGIVDGTVSVENTIFRNNQAEYSGGAIDNAGSLTILTSQFLANQASDSAGAINNGGMLDLTDTTIDGNTTAGYYGGGIINGGGATLTRVTVSNNSASYYGGGIYAQGGTLLVSESSFTGNQAEYSGGGIGGGGTVELTDTKVTGNSSGYGGGIHLDGSLTINRGLLANNTATYGGGLATEGSALLTNVTISSNTGGGLLVMPTADVLVVNATIARNTGGPGIEKSGGSISLQSSILADNPQGNCSGFLASAGDNVDSDGSCFEAGTGLLRKVDPLLGLLQDNGGSTLTHALSPSSLAIDLGGTCPVLDQRGTDRPMDGDSDGSAACDPGAFEASSVLPPPGPLSVDLVYVDDDSLGDSSGDGDGIAEPGETVELSIRLINKGRAATTGVQVSLSTSDIYATLDSNTTSAYPDIAGANGVGLPLDDFEVHISESAPPAHVMEFTVDTSAATGGPWAEAIGLDISSPQVINDQIGHAVVVDMLPHDQSVEFWGLTSSITDPELSCAARAGYHTAWYTYTPVADGSLSVDTNGSEADTVVAVWSGSPGALVNLGCVDDGVTMQAATVVPVSAGNQYFIEAGSYHEQATGNLNVEIRFQADNHLTYYVAVGGNDSNLCITAEAACATIGWATALAGEGDTVHIGPGTFHERLVIRKDIHLEGSGKNQTFVDGDNLGRVVTIPEAYSVDIQDLTIRNGRAVPGDGGGVYAAGGSLSLVGVNLLNNHAEGLGGAVATTWETTALDILYAEISGNSADGYAGGIASMGWSGTTQIKWSSIQNNSAMSGGGMLSAGPVTIVDTTFQGNHATTYAGGAILAGWGPGGWGPSPVALTITNGRFLSNSAQTTGGAISLDQGTFTINNSVFDSNLTTTGSGGAIAAQLNEYDALPVIYGSCITRNTPNSVEVSSSVGSLDATGNWWGQASGPSGAGPGSGDAVSNHVNYSGFLIAIVPNCATTTRPTVPPLAAPLTPNGTITNYRPSYTWNVVAGSREYVLLVKNSAGTNVFLQRYTASEACPAGITCVVTPGMKLANGTYHWALKTSNPVGDSAWSPYRYYTVRAPAPLTRYVSTSGNDSNDCLSTVNACATVQAAINKSLQGDIVQVLEGTFVENVNVDRDITISGAGSDLTIIDGNATASVFTVSGLLVQISDLTIRNGAASLGGGVQNNGGLTLRNVKVSGNSAESGAGLSNSYDADLRVEASEITNNTASSHGGGALLQGSVLFAGTTIAGNSAVTSGGGLYVEGGELRLTSGSLVSSNNPGGIVSWWSGEILLEDSSLDANTGHGLYMDGPYTTAAITRSTISRNTGNAVVSYSSGSMSIVNSTISGNTGNGIETNSSDGVTITNSTIVYNGENGIFSFDSAQLRNTIVAFNTNRNCALTAGVYIFSLGNNIDSGETCPLDLPSDKKNTDPILGPLQNNGGITETHALDVRSSAVDAGSTTGCPAIDQRGISRPRKGSTLLACDIGSYELKPVTPAGTSLAAPANGAAHGQVRPVFTWTDVTGPAGALRYTLQVVFPGGVVKSTVLQAKNVCAAGTCSYEYWPPLRNAAYTWRVRAENAAGVSAWTPYWSLSIAAALPGTASSLSPDAVQLYDSSPRYSWRAAENALTYRLEVMNGAGKIVVGLNYAAGTICKADGNCAVTPSLLIPASGDYTWRIQALNSTGAGEWTAAAVFGDKITRPAAPVGTSPIGDIAVPRARYQWNGDPLAQNYQLIIKNAAGTVVFNKLTSTTHGYFRPDFRLSNARYTWQVRAWNPLGWGPWSVARTFTATVPPRQTWYVSTGGNDANDCLGPASACLHIQAAIDKAWIDDRIRVAPGTYVENLQIDLDLRIEGDGDGVIIDGNQAGSVVFAYPNNGFVTLYNVTMRNGSAGFGGGLLFGGEATVVIENSRVQDNHADYGGGIYNAGGLELVLLNSTVSGNSSTNEGGGMNLTSGGGKARILNSTISGNFTGTEGGSNHVGGGIYSSQPVEITNSTLSNNTAFLGGAICSNYTGDFRITNSTITDNYASYGAGIATHVYCDGTATVKNTVIAQNRGGFNKNCLGELISLGWNIEDLSQCGFSGPHDLANTPTLLGPLQDNGGPTFTHALLPGSPALDSGTNTGCPTTDQRGSRRPQDADGRSTAICDRGAYERPDAIADRAALLSPLNAYLTKDRDVLLTWAILLDAGAEKNYQLQIAHDYYFRNTVTNQDVDGHTYMAADTPDGRYYWRVRASHGTGWGAWSAYRSFTVDTTPPLAPVLSTPLWNTLVRSTPTFYWKASTTAVRYQFEYDDMEDLSSPNYVSGELSVLSHKPSTMPLGAFYWAVRARDAAGNWSAWSSSRLVQIYPPLMPRPVLLSPGVGVTISDNTPTFSWNPVTGSYGYQFMLARDSGFQNVVWIWNLNEVIYTRTDPLEDGVYYWKVASFNQYSELNYSAARKFTVNVP